LDKEGFNLKLGSNIHNSTTYLAI